MPTRYETSISLVIEAENEAEAYLIQQRAEYALKGAKIPGVDRIHAAYSNLKPIRTVERAGA